MKQIIFELDLISQLNFVGLFIVTHLALLRTYYIYIFIILQSQY